MNWILANALIIPIAILMVLLKFKKTYFDFDGKTLLVGNGKIGTVTTIIEYFKTQNVIYMDYMFAYADTFNQNLSSWNVNGVTDCENFNYDTPQWTLPKPNFTNCTP